MKLIAFLRAYFKSFYLNVVSSIAFYPSLISVGFMLLAFALLSVEDNEVTKYLLDKAPYLVINNADTARSILSTLIGGVISLTVFSFSMVMVLLNQASSNFSPRLLPGLISDKKNQLVLGFYIGSIIYNIIVLISILPSGDSYTIQGFSILIGIVFGIWCLAFFVFFIHSISSGIQINNILKKIYNETKTCLEALMEEEKEYTSFSRIMDGFNHHIVSARTGCFQGVNLSSIVSFANDQKVNIVVAPYKSQFLLPNQVLYKYDKTLDKEAQDTLSNHIFFANERGASDNYVIGLKQIVEVGVKAMSPGINDPGTAIMTLDYLTELLALRMLLQDFEIHQSDDSSYSVQLTVFEFEDLIYDSLASYRQYCKHDVLLMEKIILMVKYLLLQPSKDEQYKIVLREQLQIIYTDIKNNISNESDRKRLLAI